MVLEVEERRAKAKAKAKEDPLTKGREKAKQITTMQKALPLQIKRIHGLRRRMGTAPAAESKRSGTKGERRRKG